MSEVNVEALLAAIQDGKPWLARFTGKEYDKAYQEYRIALPFGGGDDEE